jgi:hypothetical protein
VNALKVADPGRLLVFGLAAVLVFLASTAAGFSIRSHHHALQVIADIPQKQSVSVKGVVQAVTLDSLTLQTESGPVTLKLDADTSMEAISQATLASVRPGDWVNAGGVHNDQTVYALTTLVVIPAESLESGR